MSNEIEQTYSTEFLQRNCDQNPYEIPSDTLCIRFCLLKVTGSRPSHSPTAIITYDRPARPARFVMDKYIMVTVNDFLLKYAWKLSRILTSMDVPPVEHRTIIGKICRAVKAADVPGPPLTCVIWDVRIKLKIVMIDCLEKVRLDSLEDATSRNICVVCRESLDHFDGVEECAEHQSTVTRLPCLHLYHDDCIVKWSEVNYLCPLCRYPMPTVSEEEAPWWKDWKPNWPMVFSALAYGLHSVHWWYTICYAGRQIEEVK